MDLKERHTQARPLGETSSCRGTDREQGANHRDADPVAEDVDRALKAVGKFRAGGEWHLAIVAEIAMTHT